MKTLTAKEEELMERFWERGPLFVKEIVEEMPEPKPHFNTISTFVRILEEKGFLAHKSFGKSHQYYPIITADEYHHNTLRGFIQRYFDNSFSRMVSALVEKDDISVDELKSLVKKVEAAKKKGGKA